LIKKAAFDNRGDIIRNNRNFYRSGCGGGVSVVWEEPIRKDDGLKGSHKQRSIMAPTV
jgi:hypothetical protein